MAVYGQFMVSFHLWTIVIYQTISSKFNAWISLIKLLPKFE